MQQAQHPHEFGRAIARATHQLRDEISVYEACALLTVSVPSPKFASPCAIHGILLTVWLLAFTEV